MLENVTNYTICSATNFKFKQSSAKYTSMWNTGFLVKFFNHSSRKSYFKFTTSKINFEEILVNVLYLHIFVRCHIYVISPVISYTFARSKKIAVFV